MMGCSSFGGRKARSIVGEWDELTPLRHRRTKYCFGCTNTDRDGERLCTKYSWTGGRA